MKRGSLRADGIRNAVMAFQLAGDDLDSARSLLATFPSQAEVSSSPIAHNTADRTHTHAHTPHTRARAPHTPHTRTAHTALIEVVGGCSCGC
jgi:hypothetical protein